ncbi:hypothetical protein ACL02T_28785 [Pseudonocardia sp. RS010]|uniref:hypothetical protein n=1 Tax=Pseudonocardia sp. RS010 TaxID=3385979 RepID=UPI0039A3D78E
MALAKLRELPGRISSGGFVLHSGLEKWKAGPEQAAGVYGMATTAYPFLKRVPQERFVKALAAGEIATGVALLTPFVPAVVGGALLTAFAGSLLGLYARIPGMRRPGSIWPSQQGLGIAKDVWLAGIGVGLLADGVTSD